MLRFTAKSLEKSTFKVATNGVQSDEQEMKTGLCQGSVLSVTLFLIAINTIVDCLPQGVHCFIYADDVALIAEGVSHAEVEAKLQSALNAISQWQNETGFKISAENSSTMIFKRTTARKIQLSKLVLEGESIALNKTHKCLGVTIDQRLLLHKHVEEVASTCKQRLQFLRYVANTSWGGDRATITKLYKATILEKMLYAAPMLSSIQNSTMRKLDTIHNAGLRAISGAFYTSPIASLHAESGIPELRVLIQQRTAMLSAKLLANDDSTGAREIEEHNRTPNTQEEELGTDNSSSSGELWGETQTEHREPTITRGNQLLEQLGMELPGIKVFAMPNCAPWDQKTIPIDESLYHETKRTSNSMVIQKLFSKLKATRYRYHQTLYTDGSRKDGKSGFSVVGENVTIRRRIDDTSSIYKTESEAVKEATNQDGAEHYLICTDSLSVISELEKKKITSKWRDEMAMLFNRCNETRKHIDYCWVPSHIGIQGNELADREAKASLEGNIDRTIKLNYKEIQTNIKN
ncbi:uncharacterized protein LOC129719833 [Wyeomyia smithii]|uniref:uncharacterized protein LOC129719833 n=1 Tax=Wyeomyia smithii TaxID=174621 RepID=UPI002467BB1A|nr:uncharacterized protein LOC129719833 [Wyeomyia smithii]